MPLVEAFVTPRMIRWARERSHETTDEAARKFGVKRETLVAWENGLARPTFRKAQDLARKLHVPFGYLYLAAPPAEEAPLPDFRTVAGAPSRKPSPELLDILYDALRKQEWYRDYMKTEEAGPVPFIGRFNGAPPKEVAADIRSILGINQQFRQKCRTWEEFLTGFVQRAERVRVLVLRSGQVGSNTRRLLDVEEFRGFAISDDYAPLVFVNSRDAKAAQIFTLAHELAHLWIGMSGISNPDYAERSGYQGHTIDQHCDRIAAEVLVPEDDFVVTWTDGRSFDDNLQDLARRYKVSAFVVLRRAYDLDKLPADTYRAKYQELLSESISRVARKEAPIFYPSLLARNSTSFTHALVVAAAEGHVSPKEASILLNVRLGTLQKIESHFLASGGVNA